MGRVVVWVLLAGSAVIVLLISSVAISGWLVPPAVERVEPLQESDPGWDCRTMGDRDCGGGHVDTGNVLHLLSSGFYWDGDEWMWSGG